MSGNFTHSHTQWPVINSVSVLCVGLWQQFSDAWLLDMSRSVWQWTELTVVNADLAVQQLWCHPACRVRSVYILQMCLVDNCILTAV